MEYCAYCGSPVEKVSFAPCPKCGKPSNGAPPPVAKGGGSNAAIIVIAAVFGGLLLIAMIGIVAAIAIPNFLTAKQRAMQKRTMADIHTMATGVETYANEHNEYPQSTEARTDAWGHAIRYECLTDESGKCTGYVIGSMAKDGVLERDLREAATQPPRGTTNFDCDIVYSKGSFVEYPEGVQR